ncbi:MAG: histidine kinase [Cytophagales bacterium]|nr:histidine kinase [Cytophagales bacterium]MCA6393490.1 histidine kinase [Cytophagales bacterium]MCA6396094.1 histidine kinase [Cytophagales bacterium]MCA6403348.1 histidine kinase [Cytophagales bacterium]MCA6406153.1 histidine kinase [Cytophagales bacterium]
MKRFLGRHQFVLYLLSLVTALIITAFGLTSLLKYLYHNQTTVLQNTVNLSTFVIITSALKMYRSGIQRQLAEKELAAKQFQAELQLLRAQINPHFLFNTLNNLYSLTLEKSDFAPATVVKLSELMRYMLETSRHEDSALHAEINFIRNYLTLEKLRLNSRATIDFEVVGEPQQKTIASLLFIPFIENAFKHGINATVGDAFLYSQLRIEENELYFLIENNISTKLVEENSGTGLENVRRRLHLLYPDRHQLTIENMGTKFVVNLQLSLL